MYSGYVQSVYEEWCLEDTTVNRVVNRTYFPLTKEGSSHTIAHGELVHRAKVLFQARHRLIRRKFGLEEWFSWYSRKVPAKKKVIIIIFTKTFECLFHLANSIIQFNLKVYFFSLIALY